VHFLGMPRLAFVAPLTLIYTLFIAFLMVSRLPVFSGKKAGMRVPREMVLPLFVLVVLFVAMLVSYPWEVLTVGTLLYLGSLPFGWLSYRRHEREHAAATASATDAAAPEASASGHEPPPPAKPGADRPARLN
jgi:CDP-diacylglycerol--serine O-phosphatidyltransferase